MPTTNVKINGMFLARDGIGDPMYLYPCGDGDKKAAVKALEIISAYPHSLARSIFAQ